MIRINLLPDEEIFDLHVMIMKPSYKGKTTVESWRSLAHVCRQWRKLVFGSPHRLNLQLYCTPKTPVKDTLDIWPALPILIGGNMILSGTNNVIAALGQAHRVRQVFLYLLDGKLEEVMAAMEVSFPELTYLRLSTEFSHGEAPVIPDSFLNGSAPGLQTFHLRGIPFPGLLNLILSTTHLVGLHLSDIPRSSGYISPEAIATLLSVLSSLESLSLEFRSRQSRPDWEGRSLPPPKRPIHHALRLFDFKGATECIEELVTRIDTPRLDRMGIKFFNQINFDCPRLAQFIYCTPALRAPNIALFQFNPNSASITLQRTTHLRISISCRKPHWQLSSIGQVCNSALDSLSTVEALYIENQYTLVVWGYDAFKNLNAQWLELFLPFTAVKKLYIFREFAPGVAAALKELVGDSVAEVFPSLQNIFVHKLEPLESRPFQENIEQFVAARKLCNHPIAVSVWDNTHDSGWTIQRSS